MQLTSYLLPHSIIFSNAFNIFSLFPPLGLWLPLQGVCLSLNTIIIPAGEVFGLLILNINNYYNSQSGTSGSDCKWMPWTWILLLQTLHFSSPARRFYASGTTLSQTKNTYNSSAGQISNISMYCQDNDECGIKDTSRSEEEINTTLIGKLNPAQLHIL